MRSVVCIPRIHLLVLTLWVLRLEAHAHLKLRWSQQWYKCIHKHWTCTGTFMQNAKTIRQSIVMKPHPQTQNLEVAFSWGRGSVFLHFHSRKRFICCKVLTSTNWLHSPYHKRKIYVVLAEYNGPSNIMLGLGRREWQPLHSSPSSTDHIGAGICLEYHKGTNCTQGTFSSKRSNFTTKQPIFCNAI